METPTSLNVPFTPITHGPRVNTPIAKATNGKRKRNYDDFLHPPSPPSTRNSNCTSDEGAESIPKEPSQPPLEESRNTTTTPTPPNAEDASPERADVPTPLRGHPRNALDKGSTVIIFDWDDTLLSSTYLAGLGYRLDQVQEFSEELQSQLVDLEEHVILLLETCIEAVGADRTVIITNAERGWVELSAKKFIPNVLPILERCHVISARTTFEIDNTGPYEWKILAFYLKLQQAFAVRFPPPAIDAECPYHTVMKSIYEKFQKRHPAGGKVRSPSPDEESSGADDLDESLCSTDSNDNSTEIILAQEDQGEEETIVEEPLSEERTQPDDDGGEWIPCPGGGSMRAPPSQKGTRDLPSSGTSSEETPTKADAQPKAMLLTDQEAYLKTKSSGANDNNFEYLQDLGQNDNDLENARRALSPWQLQHVGLQFRLHENYHKVLAEPKYVISFGDSLAEKHATQTVTRSLENSVFKTIKFMERPSIHQVIKQLDLVLEHMQFFVECENPLDIVLALDV